MAGSHRRERVVKQILQSARTGELELVDVPAPIPGPGQVLVRNHFSLMSPGTEKLSMSFARKSLVAKARSRPDLARQVLRKLRHEGPVPTYRAVMTRLESPQPLGYSSAGVVLSVGAGVRGIMPGDRVACAGAGYANHAELIAVPENLVARVPDGVPLEHATFATLGAIALQGLRVADPTLGEIAAVIGLGLIGQLTVQLLRANGCRVLGLDLDPSRVKQAIDQGAEWGFVSSELPETWIDEATACHGVDMALVTASANDSSPLDLAAELCRHQGRIAVVGAMPMQLDRRVFYDKALELRMSTSYGPGRYDRTYEEQGLDYPLPYVRWTENRNLQAFLALCASGGVDPSHLDTRTVDFAEALATYEVLAKGDLGTLAAVFRYDVESSIASSVLVSTSEVARAPRESVGIGFIGAGNYGKGILLPALDACTAAHKVHIATATGASALRTAEKFGFAACATDPTAVIDDPKVDLVFVATRHDSHARLAIQALRAGKAVWLEKPVALLPEDLDELAATIQETNGFLAVGYNRRFSPHARAVRKAFMTRQGPLAIRYTIAAGPPPRGTWITDPVEGGGRIVGEVCHFVDLCTYLAGCPPSSVYARALGHNPDADDSMVAVLGFPDGSTATIEYLARASQDLPKERFEASADGVTARSDNFRVTEITGQKDVRTFNQDKGQTTEVLEVVDAVRTHRPGPFTIYEIVSVSRATFAMLESAATGAEVRI
jgi:predicted dehydrogenase/threonine dehydrogenase-like Zn-dependent dehydrogenase